MSYIALSATELSRFSHHWFWGLCIHNKQGYSLRDGALALHQNTALRQTMEASVDGFNQRPWLLRSLCWLVNYRQYRFHYYQLQGYWSWQLYQKGVTMFSTPNQSGIVNRGFMVTATSLLASKVLPKKIQASLKWFSSKVRSLRVNNTFTTLSEMLFPVELTDGAESSELITSSSLHHSEPAPLSNPASIPSFIVQETMLPTLTTLGIVTQVNECIALSRLKSAYNLSRLQTHPDKAGGESHSAFLAVTEAYDTLITLIQEQTSQAALQSPSSVFDELRKMREEISLMNQDISILRQENIQMQVEIEQNNIKLQKFAERIVRQKERDRELEERDRELEERDRELEERDMKQKQSIKKHIISINKTYNFPELTEETLQAYCKDPDSFIRKVRAHQALVEKNKEQASEHPRDEALLSTRTFVAAKPAKVSAAPSNNVVFFGNPTQNTPSSHQEKVNASCSCFK